MTSHKRRTSSISAVEASIQPRADSYTQLHDRSSHDGQTLGPFGRNASHERYVAEDDSNEYRESDICRIENHENEKWK